MLLQETFHGFRLIPTQPGRTHSESQPPAYWGDSVGKWEGDTLVVDVVNFNDRNWISTQGIISFHSDALHVTERYHRVAANAMEVEKTYDDPQVLIRPFVDKKTVPAGGVRSGHGSDVHQHRDSRADGSRGQAELREEMKPHLMMPVARTLGAAIVAACIVSLDSASGQTASRVIRQIDQRCANCHSNPNAGRAPDVAGARQLSALRTLSPEAILQSITSGTMRLQGEGIPDDVKRAMAEFLSGRKLGMTDAAAAHTMPNRCPSNPPIGSLNAAARAGTGGRPTPPTRVFRRMQASRPRRGAAL